jgi:hypothetical protein
LASGKAQNWFVAALRANFATRPEAKKTSIMLDVNENTFLRSRQFPLHHKTHHMIIDLEVQLVSDLNPAQKSLLEEFQYITLVERYILDDAENYLELFSYVELLKEIAELTQLGMQDIQGNAAHGQYSFSFTIDQNLHSISIAAPQSDWIDQTFISALNEVLKTNSIANQLYFVNVFGLRNATQCFHIAYFDPSTYLVLRRHPDGYTFGDEDDDG